MLFNYFTVALRNLRRYRSYALVNTAGLALGITCGLLIFLLVRFHLTMNAFQSKADQIYRVVTDLHFGNLIQTPGVPYPFGQAFKLDFPEVETAAQILFLHNNLVTVDGSADRQRKKFMIEREIAFAEPGFFHVFDYQWLTGKPAVLEQPFTAALTTAMATKLFGNTDPVGKTFRVDNEHDYKVVGLLADIPDNTEFRQEIFLSYASYTAITPKDNLAHWGGVSSNHQCFVVLPKTLTPEQVDQRFPGFVKKFHEDSDKWSHHLQPLSDMYFNPDYGGDVPKGVLWALAVVGLLLIGTGCINFINLATAQALNRSKEVGVRKVLGSRRSQIFLQFILETGLITLAALALSVLMVYPALPYVNELTHSRLAIRLFSDSGLAGFLLAALLGVTMLAGAYPALILSGFRPVQALKGRITTKTLRGYSMRRGLVVVQFVVCQVLIIAAIVITGQMNHLKNASLGFTTDAIVMLPVPKPEPVKIRTLRQQLIQSPGVLDVSFAFDAPAGDSHNSTNCRFDSRQEDEVWQINTRPADDQYLKTYDLNLVAGRNIQPSDTIRECLLNETAVRKLGLASAEEAIGKRFQVWGRWAPVVGIVHDFHTRSLQEPVEPVVIMSSAENYNFCGVKIDLTNTPKTLSALEQSWNAVYPEEFYSYRFLDEKISEFYELESALLHLTQGFCGIAIFIGCLGLYGLVSFMAARKQKEIGIRKVLGATAAQILRLFGKEFIRLILIAFVLAAPLGGWAMKTWLEDYPYRISLGAGIFLATIGITVFIAVLTVSAQSLRSALTNPVNSLRSE